MYGSTKNLPKHVAVGDIDEMRHHNLGKPVETQISNAASDIEMHAAHVVLCTSSLNFTPESF